MFSRKTPAVVFGKTHSLFLNSATATNLPTRTLSVGAANAKLRLLIYRLT